MHQITANNKTMSGLQPPQIQDPPSNLSTQLRDRTRKMLSFLYHLEYSLAAQQFDRKFDPHLQLKKLKKSESMTEEEFKRLYLSLSEKLHARIIREDVEADRALNKLQTLWEALKIGYFHRYYFAKSLHSTYVSSTSLLIKHEDSLLRKDQHIYFSIQRSILARAAALKQLARTLKKLGPQDLYQHFHTVKERELQFKRKVEQREYRVHGYRALYRLDEQDVSLGTTTLQTLSQAISNYRRVTVHVMQLLATWRDYLRSLTHDLRARRQSLAFYYEERNYLLTLLNDSSFIGSSFLSNFYSFASRNDPLLLHPLLSIQKLEQDDSILSFEEHQLKKIVQVQQLDYKGITFAVELLYAEVEAVVRERQIMDMHSFGKGNSLSLEQQASEVALGHGRKLQLEPLPSFKSQSLKKTDLDDRQISQNSLTKSNLLFRKCSQLSSSNSATKTFYKTIKPLNNPQKSDAYRMLNSQELLKIKQQVFQKIKLQLQFEAKKSIIESKEFEQLVDFQVKANLHQILQNERNELNALKLQITPLSITEQQLGSFLTKITKQIPISCLPMQPTPDSLSLCLSQCEYIYLLKVHSTTLTLGHVVGRISKQTKGYKLIEIVYVSFCREEYLPRIMQKVVEFMWKYQSARELTFNFLAGDSTCLKTLSQLQRSLSQYSTVIKKGKQSTNFFFIFTKKGNGQNYTYNLYPQQIHIKFYSLLSTGPLKLESLLHHQGGELHYDYLVMEMLKLYTNSEDFIVLRDTFRPKERFRHLLKHMLEMESHKDSQIQITELSAPNILQLNKTLTQMKKPLLQLSDLKTLNNIKALLCELTLSLAYSLKVVSNRQSTKMHRYSVNTTLDCLVDDQGSQYMLLEVHESHHLKLMIYNPINYLGRERRQLNLYLFEKLEKSRRTKKMVHNLWIEMARYPNTLDQKHQHYISTFASDSQFRSINKHLYVADCFDWFTDIRIQNGISYTMGEEDLVVKRPFGVAAVVVGHSHVLYSRLFQ